MILLTGAAGKTGRAVLKALLKREQTVRALVRNSKQAGELIASGAVDTITGDMEDPGIYDQALKNVKSLYHICPNMHPEELKIGDIIIKAAIRNNIEHFVYHSVLHPQTEKMPHHWNKLRVEEKLFESGLGFTVLQPAPYMQNILGSWESIKNESVFKVPYPVTTRLSLVDLQDLARAAAAVLCEPGHKGAVYEIVGTTGLSQLEVAEQLSNYFGQTIEAGEQLLGEWRSVAYKSGMDLYQLETLASMFSYYASYGLEGNSNILSWLLKGKPGELYSFIKREFSKLI